MNKFDPVLARISSSCRLILVRSNEALSEAKCPISYIQLMTLKAIGNIEATEGAPPFVKKIADAVGLERSAMSHGTDKLVELGYVTKSYKKPGQAVTTISLTEAGKEVVKNFAELQEGFAAQVLRGVSAGFMKDLERIERNLL